MDLARSIFLSLGSVAGCLGAVSGLLALARVRALEPRVAGVEDRAVALEGRADLLEPLGHLATVLAPPRFDGDEQPKSVRVAPASSGE